MTSPSRAFMYQISLPLNPAPKCSVSSNRNTSALRRIERQITNANLAIANLYLWFYRTRRFISDNHVDHVGSVSNTLDSNAAATFLSTNCAECSNSSRGNNIGSQPANTQPVS